MSDNPRLNPNISPSKSTGTALNPILAKALASLEVELDRELARYRRTRIGSRIPNPPRIVNSITSQSLGLQLYSPSVNMNPPSDTTEGTNDTPVNTSTDKKTTGAARQNQSAPSLSSSIVSTGVKSDGDTNVTHTNNHSPEPEDYLESSEVLLRSLTEEQKQKKNQYKKKKTSDGLLSPVGSGSILLLLLASLTLGYVIFNPKSLPLFSLNGLFQRQPGNKGVGELSIPNQPQTPISPIPKYPNLAAKEFPEVNSPNDIVGLTPKSKATPITPTSPKTSPLAASPIQPVQQLTPKPQVNSTPQPSPTASQIPLRDIKPSSDGFYHVVTNNQGNNTLTKAKAVVGDAYLSNDRTIIYLGALKTKARAQELLKQLRAQGINARVKQP
ncbi:MAG: hypothetical protein HRU34_14685 [Richelia sp.]|nr:hypothetical protein [Richelia sp.]